MSLFSSVMDTLTLSGLCDPHGTFGLCDAHISVTHLDDQVTQNVIMMKP